MVEKTRVAVRLGTEIHFYTLAVGIYLEKGKNAAQETHQIAAHRIQGHFIALYLTEGQQLPYHSLDPGYISLDVNRIFVGRRILRKALLEFAQRIHYESKRCLQIVGDIGKELDSGPRQFLHILLLQLLHLKLVAIYLLIGEKAPYQVYQGQHDDSVEHLCPPGKERTWMYGPLHGSDTVSPKAIVVRCFDFETVTARIQVIITHCILPRIKGCPLIRQPHQAARIAVVFGVKITVGRKSESDIGLPVIERKALIRPYVLFCRDRTGINPHIREENHALVLVGANVSRTEEDETIGASEHQFSPGTHKSRADVERSTVAGSIESGWHDAPVGPAEQSLVCTEPDFLRYWILHYSEHGASVKGDIGVGSILGQNVQPAALGAQQKLSIGASAIAAKVVNRVGLPFQTIGSQDVQGRIVQHVQALMCQQPQAPLPIVEEGFHLANLTAA